MNFTISELEVIYRYSAQTKADTLRGLKEIIPEIWICSHAAVASGHIRPDRKPGRDI